MARGFKPEPVVLLVRRTRSTAARVAVEISGRDDCRATVKNVGEPGVDRRAAGPECAAAQPTREPGGTLVERRAVPESDDHDGPRAPKLPPTPSPGGHCEVLRQVAAKAFRRIRCQAPRS